MGELGEMSFGLELGELVEASFDIFELDELGEGSLGIISWKS